VVRVLAVVAVTIVVAGCSMLPPPAGIQLTLPAVVDEPGVPPVPVTVVDHAGIVRDAAPAERSDTLSGDTGVAAIQGQSDAVLFTWLGGECLDRAIVTIDAAGAGYRVTVDEPSSAMGCSAVGVIRTIRLGLTKPVPPEAFETP
jgi:hypothetical protein